MIEANSCAEEGWRWIGLLSVMTWNDFGNGNTSGKGMGWGRKKPAVKWIKLKMLMKMLRNRNGGMISYLCALELMLKVISQPSLFIVLAGAQRIFPESSTTSLSYISFIFINSNVHILLLSTQVFFFMKGIYKYKYSLLYNILIQNHIKIWHVFPNHSENKPPMN